MVFNEGHIPYTRAGRAGNSKYEILRNLQDFVWNLLVVLLCHFGIWDLEFICHVFICHLEFGTSNIDKTLYPILRQDQYNSGISSIPEFKLILWT